MKIDVGALTADAPFRAGALLFRGSRLVLTLDDDDLPSDLAGRAWRVKWVGGGQNAGENPWECALREAHEEVGASVDLVPSPATYFFDWEERRVRAVECDDPDPPILFERTPRANPDVAAAPGIPTGPHLYAATSLALAGTRADMRPADDLAGLLLLPLEAWPLLERGTSLAETLEAGAEVVEREPLAREARLWLHPTATIRIAVPLLNDRAVRAALGL